MRTTVNRIAAHCLQDHCCKTLKTIRQQFLMNYTVNGLGQLCSTHYVFAGLIGIYTV